MPQKDICPFGTGGRIKIRGAGTALNRSTNGLLASVALHLLNINLCLPQVIGITADSATGHASRISHLTNPRLLSGFDVIAFTAIDRV